MKICHLTSVHTQEDIRIFHKECVTLAKAGYDTYQVSCGSCYQKDGVHLIGVGEAEKKRLKRVCVFAKKVYRKAKVLDADIYHLHDPELLPYGLKLKKAGKTVFFDSHEDIPAQIMDKTWIPILFRRIISKLYVKYETHAVKRLDAVVAATPYIAGKFEARAPKVITVNNYPKLDDIVYHESPLSGRESIVCYAGGISDARGEGIMIEAMKEVEGELLLAGDHEKLCTGNVRYLGKLDREGVNQLYAKAVVGLCVLKPIKNYINSQPTKIYEYMAAGLPFICSDFPRWREIADNSHAGFCVDPSDLSCITALINRLLEDRALAEKMGRAGREYMVSHYTWDREGEKLVSLYNSIRQDANI